MDCYLGCLVVFVTPVALQTIQLLKQKTNGRLLVEALVPDFQVSVHCPMTCGLQSLLVVCRTGAPAHHEMHSSCQSSGQ